MNAKGSPVVSMCSAATSRRWARSAGSSGSTSLRTPMDVSMSWVIRPISSCWGSSGRPGRPRQVTRSRTGRRRVWQSEVSGLTVLPRPEFWRMTTGRRPARTAPAARATASPSLAAMTYSCGCSASRQEMTGPRNEQGTPVNGPCPCSRSRSTRVRAWRAPVLTGRPPGWRTARWRGRCPARSAAPASRSRSRPLRPGVRRRAGR